MYEFKTHEFTSSGRPPQWYRTLAKLATFLVYYWLVSMTTVRHHITGVNDTSSNALPLSQIPVKCVLKPNLFYTKFTLY